MESPVKAWMGISLVCLLVPMQTFAANTQIAMCKRGHLNYNFGPYPGEVSDLTITSIWLDSDEKDKIFIQGRVMKVSLNGDFMLRMEPSKERAGSGSVIIYTAGLHQAVLITDADPDAATSVAVADCTIKTIPSKATP
jgi:hypothetical protein